MNLFNLYHIACYLLTLGFLAHTFGGILRPVLQKRKSGVPENDVFIQMKAVTFKWRGAKSTWFNWYVGNGLGVSALLILEMVTLWTLGSLTHEQVKIILAIPWAAFASLVLLTYLGFRFFAPLVGVTFGLIAILTGIAAYQSTF